MPSVVCCCAHWQSIVDPLGRPSVAAEYRGDGRLGKTEDAAGSSTEFSYELDQRTQIATTAGITSVVVGDADGNVVQQHGPAGTTIRSYDSRGRVLDETTIVGNPDTAANGENDDINAEFTYTIYGLPATQTDDRGNSTSLEYDNDDGNVTSIADAFGNTTTNTYDNHGNLLTTKTGDVNTTLEYDAWGNVTKISNNANRVLAQSFYNDYGLLERSIDANGRETHFSYDALGNLDESWYVDTETINVGNGPETREIKFLSRSGYDAEGRATASNQIVQRQGEAEKFIRSSYTDYNLAGQVFQSRSRSYADDGSFTELISQYRYDVRGNTVEVRSQGLASGSTTPIWFVQRTVYDALGRVSYSSDRFPEGTPVAEITGSHSMYDTAGRVIASTRVTGLDIVVAAIDGSIAEANRVYSATLPTVPTALTSTTSVYAKNRLVETTDVYGRKTEYTYNQFGETTQVHRQATDAAGNTVWLVSRSVYDSKGRVVSSTDEYREGTNQQIYGSQTLYDSNGRVSQTIRRVGVVIALDAAGTTSVVKEGAVLQRATNRYDNQGRLAETVAANGQITSYEYDSLGRQVATLGHPQQAGTVGLIVQGDPLVRLRSETVFGNDGRVQQQITNIRHYANGSIDRSVQQVTSYEYDVAGNTIKVTQSAAGSDLVVWTETEYDDFGRKTAAIDPVGNRTEYAYDLQGRLQKVILPAVPDPQNGGLLTNPIYEYLYDASGNQTHIIDPYGHTTVFTFDEFGRQLTRTLPLGFGADGQPETADDLPPLPPGEGWGEGRFTERFEYDDRGRQFLHVSFEGVVTELVFDDTMVGGGRLAAKQFYPDLSAYNNGQGTPSERWLTTYDEFGRQVLVERQTLDAQGTVTESLVTTYKFNAAGRLTRVESPEGVINYEYDSLGRKTRTFTGTVANPMDDWYYTYDSLNRPISIVMPTRDGATVDIYRIANGQFLPDLIRPELTTYHYDLLGNLDWQLSDQLWFSSYDGLYTHRVRTDYVYDSMSRLDKLSQELLIEENGVPVVFAPLAEFDYELRADGKRIGVVEKLQKDAFNDNIIPNNFHVEQVNSIAWEYDALGRLVREDFVTNVDELAAQDPESWYTEDGATRPLRDFADTYSFDLAGNRIRKTTDFDLSTQAVDQIFNYGFDANDRLRWEHSDLDANGVIDELASYAYGANNSGTQQTSKTVTDPIGTLKSKIENQYDLQGRMAATVSERFAADGATVIDRESTSFDYDHTGIRVTAHNKLERIDGDTGQLVTRHELDTKYLVDHQNFTGYQQVLREVTTNADGYVVQKVVYTLGHDVVSQWSSGGIHTYTDPVDENQPNPPRELYAPSGSHLLMYDGHGSVRSILPLGNSWAIAATKAFTYDAYGNALGFNPTYAGTVILYSGEQYDARIQQQYLRARYYDAVSGTLNRLDPFAGNMHDPQSLHKYAYVHGDPIGGIDPTGMVGDFTLSGLGARIGASARMVATTARSAVSTLARLAWNAALPTGAQGTWAAVGTTFATRFTFHMLLAVPRVHMASQVGKVANELGLLASALHYHSPYPGESTTDYNNRARFQEELANRLFDRASSMKRGAMRSQMLAVRTPLYDGQLGFFVPNLLEFELETPWPIRLALEYQEVIDAIESSWELATRTDMWKKMFPDATLVEMQSRGLDQKAESFRPNPLLAFWGFVHESTVVTGPIIGLRVALNNATNPTAAADALDAGLNRMTWGGSGHFDT